MIFSANNWMFGQEDAGVQFERLARQGYNAIELFDAVGRYSTGEIVRLSEQHKLGISAVYGNFIGTGQAFVSFVHPNKGVERALFHTRRNVDFAQAVKSPFVVVVPGAVGLLRYVTSREEDLKLAADTMKRIAEYSEKHRVMLLVEPLNRYETKLLNTVEETLAFLSMVGHPNVGISLSTFHMNIEEKSLAAAIETAGPHLKLLHVSDSNQLVPGEGNIDWGAVFAALRKIGYEGALSLEVARPKMCHDEVYRRHHPAPVVEQLAASGLARMKEYASAGA